jgi:nucleoside-diphosphate-sugar epimerase
MSVNVFLTGSTGYIGGSLLAALLKDDRFKISALVRAEDKAKLLRDVGVTPIIGTLDDSETITKAASEADIAIETANCDHLGNAKAIIAGLEKRYKQTGKKPIYIQTSGSGILIDPSKPLFGETNPVIYDDTNDEQLSAIPTSWPHREVDDYIIKNSSSFNLVIVTPTLVYGKGSGIEGISNNRSQQVPFLIKASLKHKKAFQVGQGKNIWSTIHVEDLTSLYTLLIDNLLQGKITTLGAQGYFFVENGEAQFDDIVKKIAEVGHNKKVFASADVQAVITEEEIANALGNPHAAFYVGTNSRARATKARKLGWKPKHASVFDTIEDEFEHWQKKQ